MEYGVKFIIFIVNWYEESVNKRMSDSNFNETHNQFFAVIIVVVFSLYFFVCSACVIRFT